MHGTEVCLTSRDLIAALLRVLKMKVTSKSVLDFLYHVVTLKVKNGIPLNFQRRYPSYSKDAVAS